MPLVTAFGWSDKQILETQDILEFWRVFIGRLMQQGFSEILDKIFLSKLVYAAYGRKEEVQGKSSFKCHP